MDTPREKTDSAVKNERKGFPFGNMYGILLSIQTGLPVLEACLSEGMSRNDAGVVTLMHLIARGGDTNMIKRGGAALAGEVVCGVRDCLRADSRPSADCVRAWDALFIRHRLSPGGCADLLAVSYFLHDWTRA